MTNRGADVKEKDNNFKKMWLKIDVSQSVIDVSTLHFM
jgi:hypothetical protein